MKASELVSVWSAPDNSRLTSKQFSFRLPVHVAAKLAALGEIFPNKSRTEIVGDLLSTAIEDVYNALPSHAGEQLGYLPGTDEPYYEEIGKKSEFRHAANRHYVELEREMGNESPEKLYQSDHYCVGGDKKI